MTAISWEVREVQAAVVLDLQQLAAGALHESAALQRMAVKLADDPHAMGNVLQSMTRYRKDHVYKPEAVATLAERLEATQPERWRRQRAKDREAQRVIGLNLQDRKRADAEYPEPNQAGRRRRYGGDRTESERLATSYDLGIRGVIGMLLRASDALAADDGDTAEIRRQLDAAIAHGSLDVGALYRALGYEPKACSVLSRRPGAVDQPAEGKIIAFRGGERRP